MADSALILRECLISISQYDSPQRNWQRERVCHFFFDKGDRWQIRLSFCESGSSMSFGMIHCRDRVIFILFSLLAGEIESESESAIAKSGNNYYVAHTRIPMAGSLSQTDGGSLWQTSARTYRLYSHKWPTWRRICRRTTSSELLMWSP